MQHSVTEDIRTALEMLKEYVEKDEDDPDPGASRDLLRWAVDGVERLERALAAYKEAESVERREWLAELWRRETPTPARWRGLDWII